MAETPAHAALRRGDLDAACRLARAEYEAAKVAVARLEDAAETADRRANADT